MTTVKPERRFELQRIRVNAQGYDTSGAYWGAGPDVFIAASPEGNDEIMVRASTVKEAREKIAAELARAPGEARRATDKLGGNAPRKTRYEVEWLNALTQESVKIRITHARDYLASGTDHIEIESIKPTRAPLPVTETGYRSHFISALELINAGGPVAFVRAWLDQMAMSKEWRAKATVRAQGDLFQWAASKGEVVKRTRTSQSTQNAGTAQRRDGKPSRRRKPGRAPT